MTGRNRLAAAAMVVAETGMAVEAEVSKPAEAEKVVVGKERAAEAKEAGEEENKLAVVEVSTPVAAVMEGAANKREVVVTEEAAERTPEEVATAEEEAEEPGQMARTETNCNRPDASKTTGIA